MPVSITKPLDQLKTEAIARVNAKAGETILAKFPQHKQTNFATKALRLQNKPSRTKEETDELAEIHQNWDWINTIVAQSNIVNAAIQSATTAKQIYDLERGN